MHTDCEYCLGGVMQAVEIDLAVWWTPWRLTPRKDAHCTVWSFCVTRFSTSSFFLDSNPSVFSNSVLISLIYSITKFEKLDSGVCSTPRNFLRKLVPLTLRYYAHRGAQLRGGMHTVASDWFETVRFSGICTCYVFRLHFCEKLLK